MLQEIRRQIDHSLETFMDQARADYHLETINPLLFESIRDFVLRPGKRIRPLLLILSYQGYSKNELRLTEAIYRASVCIELLHNFMLIHDDIIDQSDLRRNKPTMHRMLEKIAPSSLPDKLGTDLAIIAGDIVYALAIDAFLSFEAPPKRLNQALKYFVQTAAFTAMGEFVDTLNGVLPMDQVSENDVFLNYSLKTARYTFDCPLVIGALLSGASAHQTSLLAELGLLIGQAFQIQDDIIGIFDSEKNIGKSILSDIAESKKTILVCHAARTLNKTEQERFLRHFSRPRTTLRDLEAVRTALLNAGSLDYALEHIRTRIDRSSRIIKKLTLAPASRDLVWQTFAELFRHSEHIAGLYDRPLSLNI